MALSNTTSLNELVGEIVARDAQSAAYANRVMRPLIRGYQVPPGAGSIVVPRFESVGVEALTEGVAPGSTQMSTVGETLEPLERGTYVQISKRVLHTDPFQDLGPYGDQLGRALAQDEDERILGVMDFSESVNTSGAVDKDGLLEAIAFLEGNNVPGPYFAVFHPNSWAKIRSEIGDWSTFADVGKQTVQGFAQGFTNANGYVGSPYGIPCFISTAVGDDGAATPSRRHNVVFSRESAAAAWIRDIGIDVDDNVVARALDLMAWYAVDTVKLVDEYGVVLEDTLS